MPRVVALIVALLTWLQLPGNPTGVHVNAGGGTWFTGTTRTAASCENKAGQTDVQDKIDASSSLDIVVIPAGTCTWTTRVSISGKSIKLKGSGTGSTIITGDTTNDPAGLTVTATTTNYVQIQDFTFKATSNVVGANNHSLVRIDGTIGSNDAFRVTNMIFDDGTNGQNGRLLTISSVYGVVDNNVFWRRSGGQPMDVYGSPDGTDIGYTPWTAALNKGSKEAVTVEDNVFHKLSQVETIDAYGGARTVFRLNTFDGECMGRHGFDSGNRRSALWDEYYYNALTWTGGGNPCGGKAGQVRGGSEVMFGNTFDSSYNGLSVEVYYARATNSYTSDPGMSGWLYCDGTKYDLDSQLTHSTTFNTVNRFRSTDNETTCSGAGNCTVPVDVAAVTGSVSPYGYPCRDQPGVGPGQVSVPLYQWNNSGRAYAASYNACGGQGVGDGTCSPLVAGGLSVSTWIASDRDYYNGASGVQSNSTTPFNGTTGVGWGTLANRPTTCTVGVAYFATDQGSWNTSSTNPQGVQQNGADGVLYTCTSTNTWSTYYTPYTYPHPLQSRT